MPLLITPKYLQERGDFYDQLARMLSAGVPMIQVVEMISRSSPSGVAKAMTLVHAKLNSSYTLSESLRALDGWAPEFDIALVESGEKSGRLDQTFRMLAGYYSEKAKLNKRILNELLYPVFMLHFAVFVFPPHLIGKLVWEGAVAEFFTQKAIVLGVLYAGIFIFLKGIQSQRNRSWRAMLEGVSRFIPVLGNARRSVALARLSAALEALITAGQPIARCWELAAQASGSLYFQKAAQPVIAGALAGDPPGEVLQKRREFPEMFSNLYRTGEISGDLDGSLRRLNEYYAEEGTRKMHALSQWIPRIIYFVILVGIGYYIVSFWSGYFQGVSDAMGGE